VHQAAHSRACFSLSWTPGGLPESDGGLGLLASAGGDGKIIVWQVTVATPSETEPAPEPHVHSHGSGTCNHDHSTPGKPNVKLEPIAALRDAHGVSDVNSVGWCVREDGKGQGMLASAGDDGSIKVWRVVADA
jgi:WD40 repeat protein